MKKLPILLLTALLFAACDDDANYKNPLFGKDYFPLHVGDYWEYTTSEGMPMNRSVKREITTTVTINQKEYYLMTTRTRYRETVSIDTFYYRVDNEGSVYGYHPRLPHEVNPFRLAEDDGANWQYQDEFDGTITLDQYRTVDLNKIFLDSCKRFSYDAESIEDEDHYYILAPGLGLVSDGSYMWGFRKTLKKAMINGVKYEF